MDTASTAYAQALLDQDKEWDEYTAEEQVVLRAYLDRASASSRSVISDLSMVSSVPSTATGLPRDLLRQKYNDTSAEFSAWSAAQQERLALQRQQHQQQQPPVPPQTPRHRRSASAYSAVTPNAPGGSPTTDLWRTARGTATTAPLAAYLVGHGSARSIAQRIPASPTRAPRMAAGGADLGPPPGFEQLRNKPGAGWPLANNDSGDPAMQQRLHHIREEHDELMVLWRRHIDGVLDCEQHMRQLLLEADEIATTLRSSGVPQPPLSPGLVDSVDELVGSLQSVAMSIEREIQGSRAAKAADDRDGGSETEIPAQRKLRRKRKGKSRAATGEQPTGEQPAQEESLPTPKN